MQGERNHTAPAGGVGLGRDSQLAAGENAADDSFVDSSQAAMFLELLKTKDEEEQGTGELAGVEVAVEAVRLALNELMATLVRKRAKTRLVSVGMYETAWLEPSPEQQSCARINSTEGEPISFVGMQNKDFRMLAQAMMGMPVGSEDAQSGPLASSEKQLLGVVADRLIGKLYTANDPIESIGMPAPAQICQPEDALDLADRGCELVLVKFETTAGSQSLPVELLFPLETLEATTAEENGGSERPKQGAKQDGTPHAAEDTNAKVRGSVISKELIGEVPVSATCELFCAEFLLSEVNQLSPGQILGEANPMNDIRILDAENRPFLAGMLRVENGKLTMVARSMVKNTSKGAA